jgi:hypothetical protein
MEVKWERNPLIETCTTHSIQFLSLIKMERVGSPKELNKRQRKMLRMGVL